MQKYYLADSIIPMPRTLYLSRFDIEYVVGWSIKNDNRLLFSDCSMLKNEYLAIYQGLIKILKYEINNEPKDNLTIYINNVSAKKLLNKYGRMKRGNKEKFPKVYQESIQEVYNLMKKFNKSGHKINYKLDSRHYNTRDRSIMDNLIAMNTINAKKRIACLV